MTSLAESAFLTEDHHLLRQQVLHGGFGYMRGYLVERLYRDVRIYPIGGGTREVMNEIIARNIGL